MQTVSNLCENCGQLEYTYVKENGVVSCITDTHVCPEDS